MKKHCPSCGAVFDGKHCKECLYTSFSEDIGEPSLHTHGERVHTLAELDDSQCSAQPQQPVRPSRPVQPYRPVRPRRQTGNREGYAKFKKGALSIILRIVIIWFALFLAVPFILPKLISLGTDRPEPEERPGATNHVPQVAKPVVELYCDDRVRIVVEWDGGPITDTLTVAVENYTDEPLRIYTPAVSVNGIMTEECFIYCEAEPNTITEAWFWFTPEDLEPLGITEVYQVDYVVEVINQEYETLEQSEKLSFGFGGTFQVPQQEGEEIWNDAGVRILYQGLRKDAAGFPYLLFYAENLSKEKGLFLISTEIWVDGEDAELAYWQNMFPDTCGFTKIYMEDYEPETLQEVEMILRITRPNDPEGSFDTDPIVIRVQ